MDLLSMIQDGRTDLILDHLDNDGSHSDKCTEGHSLITIAAYYGDVSAIKFLISNGAHLEDLGHNFDLNGAAFHGHWQLCQYLLEQGADPNDQIKDTGETPLHSCLSKANNRQSIHICTVLLAHGADPNKHTIPGIETGGFMRDAYTYGETPLHRAAAFGSAEVIQCLLDGGAKKDEKDVTDSSPLSWASWHLRPGKILSLLAYGPHHIHPLHVERIQSDHGFGNGGGVMSGLYGKVHV